METIWNEISLGTEGWPEIARILVRMIAAAGLGAFIGYERQKAKKAAGLRTHVMVTLGTCVFVLSGTVSGMSSDGLSRVIQGIATGVGFIGAGAILKLNEERDIRGLTTAAGIWAASAIGVACGLGEIVLAVIATGVSLVILTFLKTQDEQVQDNTESTDGDQNKS